MKTETFEADAEVAALRKAAEQCTKGTDKALRSILREQKRETIIVAGHGVTISTSHGQLRIQDGFTHDTQEEKSRTLPKGANVNRVGKIVVINPRRGYIGSGKPGSTSSGG